MALRQCRSSLALCLHRAGRHVRTVPSARAQSTRASFYYQGAGVPTSILSTGKVGTVRDARGSDAEFFGVDPVPVDVEVRNGRGRSFSVDENGFKLVDHAWGHIDYYNNEEVLRSYYPECEALVCRETGASFALAFDHNIRARQRKLAGESLVGGNAVQEPLIGYGVHNDYTATSAPKRIRQLSAPPKENDTMRQICGSSPPIDPSRVETLLRGRWIFMNVWRNIAREPVERFPLGLCDAASVSAEDLVVFEIRYSDRVGENYFARHGEKHRWVYFPGATRDEAVLLKCWDSRGRDFLSQMPGHEPGRAEPSAVPATFSLHSGFDDPQTLADAPDRESMEVRLVAFFEDA
mmetsp:Transcript_12769/g.36244  ORF Transcript_12769/g.36244 Transcript_12769/m.36244 type:complete len:350 (-) Transcript_12769:244-1293(-)